MAVFQRVLHQQAVWSKFDRYGLMRPTDVHPEWQTDRGFVHWDQNPTLEPNFARVQGVVALSEHSRTSGGFWCIPNFTKGKFAQWARANPRGEQDGDLIDVTDDCLRHRHAQKITMRAGSICIWDSRTPHGNWPNERTNEWRLCLYQTFFCVPLDNADVRARWAAMCRALPFATGLSPLGQCVFGIADWPASAPSDTVDRASCYTASQCGYG